MCRTDILEGEMRHCIEFHFVVKEDCHFEWPITMAIERRIEK